jgi:tRNA pseudouridine13 synthase
MTHTPLSFADYLDLPNPSGPPPARGRVRAAPEDFVVIEDLGFEPDGEGDHAFLRVRKRNANTEWVGRRLAEFVGALPRDVGYAGLKDRFAVTEQTFSVLMPNRGNPDWSTLDNDEFEVLSATRNRRKLRNGVLAGNHFRLVIRDLAGSDGGSDVGSDSGSAGPDVGPDGGSNLRPGGGPVDRSAIEARLARIAETGVPNYFGPQRFGIEGGNLAMAAEIFAGRHRERDRHKRGLYFSAARSYLFNKVLSHRVAEGLWNRAIPGDAMMLDGSRSFFVAETIDAEIERRLGEFDIHPTGPLYGKGELKSAGEARALEEAVLAPLAFWCEGIAAEGLDQNRRALRLRVTELTWEWPDDTTLTLAFRLPPGAYATTVLREVVEAPVDPSAIEL